MHTFFPSFTLFSLRLKIFLQIEKNSSNIFIIDIQKSSTHVDIRIQMQLLIISAKLLKISKYVLPRRRLNVFFRCIE